MASKKQIYSNHGIEYKNGKILSPIGWIPELLKKGNSKTGKAVYTWSILSGTGTASVNANGTDINVKGTCVCDCVGCYAQTGFYKMSNVFQ